MNTNYGNESENINLIVKTTSLVMYIVKNYISRGDLVVDCTMGNGHDTLSLACAVGITESGADSAGIVLSFDVQDSALKNTEKLLAENGINNIEKSGIFLIKDSHENIDKYLKTWNTKPSAIVFNLGFMPGGDKTILTEKHSTVKAVKKAIELIKDDGIVSVTTYSGHPEGAEENIALLETLRTLPPKRYHVVYMDMLNQRKTAPRVFFITRKKRKTIDT